MNWDEGSQEYALVLWRQLPYIWTHFHFQMLNLAEPFNLHSHPWSKCWQNHILQNLEINASTHNELAFQWITAKLWHKHSYFNELRKVAVAHAQKICTYLNRIELWQALREPFFKLLHSKKDIFPCFYWSKIRRNWDSEFAKSRNQGQLNRNLTNWTTWIISSRSGSQAFICKATRISKTNKLAAVSTHHMHFTLFARKRWRWFRSRTIFTWTKRAMKQSIHDVADTTCGRKCWRQTA